MEILRGGRAVGDPNVALGGLFEEALEARTRMLRPLPVAGVREQKDERRLLAPLRAGGDDELVKDDLSAVHEVAVLRLPQHQRLGRLHAVAELEADAGAFRERAVVHLEGGTGARVVAEWD